MATEKKTLKQWFSNFKKPTQEQFWAWLDSFWHKSEKIPMAVIEDLESSLEKVATSEQLNNHESDLQAHSDLFAQKVDKEQGKGLSTNDFTDAYKQQIDDLQLPDLTPYLLNGGYDGTAQDLKNAVDLINAVLQSDDSTLDELQEIVNYIKMNKSDLQNLSIDNIAGLSEALHKLNNQNYVLKTSANINTSQPINNISQNGRNVVTIGSSNIVVTVDSIDGFMATYQKGGTGNITFQAGTGKTLIQVDGTNIVNGSIGSTATITVVGNEILLRISNA